MRQIWNSFNLLPGLSTRTTLLTALIFVYTCSNSHVYAQQTVPKTVVNYSNFGYVDKGDSIEFIFGQQHEINISGLTVSLDKRFNEIEQVNLAGSFNAWSSNAAKYQMVKAGRLFTLTILKAAIGKKGDILQFKFVLNHKYWVEPPPEASNKYKGADGNTNLTLRL